MLKTITNSFKNQHLLTEALTHRSFLNEHPEVKNSNERLEFLGDSVLQILSSAELFQRFPDYPEGKLTSLRSQLVRAKTLAQVAFDLDMGSDLLMSKGEEKSGGKTNPSLLANTFEAVLGAMFLDQGLETAKKFLEKHLFPLIDDAKVDDFKSRLQEITQKENRQAPSYKLLTEVGPDHDKTFTVGVYLKSKLLAEGTAKNKHEAEQQAAKLALENLKTSLDKN